MNAALTTDGDEAVLRCDRGFMRLLISQAQVAANSAAQATGGGANWKANWARRSKAIGELVTQLPEPPNPRDPYEDLPDEPTPEVAAARWAERHAAEDAREAGRRAVATAVEPEIAPRHFYHLESDCLMITTDGSHPGTDGLVEEITREDYDRIAADQEAARLLSDDSFTGREPDHHSAFTSNVQSVVAGDDIEDLLA